MITKSDILNIVTAVLGDAKSALEEMYGYDYTLEWDDVQLLLNGIYRNIKERIDELEDRATFSGL